MPDRGRDLLVGALAATGARAAWAVRGGVPRAAAWERTNHRGTRLTLLQGPAVAAGCLVGVVAAPLPREVRAGAAVAVLGGAVLGAVDDLGERSGADVPSKGLRGHLGALARGRVTTGALKVVGIGASGALAAALVRAGSTAPPALTAPSPSSAAHETAVGLPWAARAGGLLADGALVAGAANLLNLLDLRPGRALKAAVLLGAGAGPLGLAAAGASAALLPVDLAERGMLGDTGANAVGGLLGAALVHRCGRRSRTAALAVVVGLTLASERVSFTRVIDATPGLRHLDRLGRRS